MTNAERDLLERLKDECTDSRGGVQKEELMKRWEDSVDSKKVWARSWVSLRKNLWLRSKKEAGGQTLSDKQKCDVEVEGEEMEDQISKSKGEGEGQSSRRPVQPTIDSLWKRQDNTEDTENQEDSGRPEETEKQSEEMEGYEMKEQNEEEPDNRNERRAEEMIEGEGKAERREGHTQKESREEEYAEPSSDRRTSHYEKTQMQNEEEEVEKENSGDRNETDRRVVSKPPSGDTPRTSDENVILELLRSNREKGVFKLKGKADLTDWGRVEKWWKKECEKAKTDSSKCVVYLRDKKKLRDWCRDRTSRYKQKE